MKRRLISVLAVISVISMLCGCSEAKDLCREMLENTRDFLMDNEKDVESRDEYESTYESITEIIDTETALPDESDYIPLPDEDDRTEYDGKYFSVSPSDKWEYINDTEYECMYVIKEPESVEEAGFLLAIRADEGTGSDYFSIYDITDGMISMYEELDYEILEYGDTSFRDYDGYYFRAASPYDTCFTITYFQTEECCFSIDIVYSTGQPPEEIEQLSEEILSVFVIK